MAKEELKFFEGETFRPYIVHYNLVYQYSDVIEKAFADEGKSIVVIFPSQKPMLIWTRSGLALKKKEEYFEEIMTISETFSLNLERISGKKEDVEIFSRLHEEIYNSEYKIEEELISYFCQKIMIPLKKGRLIKAGKEHTEILAKFINKFELELFNEHQTVEDSMRKSELLVQVGQSYLWKDGESITGMGLISGRSEHVGRVNYIYVDEKFRNKGYAGMIVASVCEILQAQNRLPVLYAAKKDIFANRLYKKIGFEADDEICFAKNLYSRIHFEPICWDNRKYALIKGI